MEILRYGPSNVYEFRNESSDKLVIHIEGSDVASNLGKKKDKKWEYVKLGTQVLQTLQDQYTIIIPEKLNFQPGEEDFSEEFWMSYTAENVLKHYTDSINAYLSEHSYSSIVLIGVSEGGLLLPLIYEKINDKNLVTGMVSVYYGGLSLFESSKILATLDKIKDEYLKEAHQILVDIYSQDSATYPESIDEGMFSSPYKWWTSFIHIRPFDYYKNIQIPVLFLHGEKDYHISVESSRYVQKNLPDKPFEYIYYKGGHGPENYFDMIKLRKDIANWVIKNDS
jgi:esterase/lipase